MKSKKNKTYSVSCHVDTLLLFEVKAKDKDAAFDRFEKKVGGMSQRAYANMLAQNSQFRLKETQVEEIEVVSEQAIEATKLASTEEGYVNPATNILVPSPMPEVEAILETILEDDDIFPEYYPSYLEQEVSHDNAS
jgi:Zn-dependent oligopeptidase